MSPVHHGSPALDRIGLVVGLMLTTRPELAVFAVLLAVPIHELAHRARGFAIAGAVASVPCAVQALLFHAYGKNITPHAEFVQLLEPHFLRLMFGPRNGIFYQQPQLVVAAIALTVSTWRSPRGRLLLASIIVVLWINASAWDPWGGFAIGARRAIPLLPFMALGVAQAWAALSDGPGGRAPVHAWLRSAAGGFVVLALAVYGAWLLDHDHAIAAERGAPPNEGALERFVGMTTAYPLLASMQLQGSGPLDRTYRMASYTALYRWPTQPRAVYRLFAGSDRFDDLRVERFEAEGRQHQSFFLPLHRTPLARVQVRTRPESAVVLLCDGTPATPVPGPPGVGHFEARSAPGADSVWLEVITPANTSLEELALSGP
jgi:hypothetical protein